MSKTWGIVFAGAVTALAVGCDGSSDTTGTGGGSSSSSTKSATGSTNASGSTSVSGTGSGSGSGSGTGSSTGSLMAGNCTPSASNSGATADCAAICNAILAAQCPDGPKNQQDCLEACTGEFPVCPQFDNFIDCGGETATWTCSMTQSGVTPSKCGAEWGCMEAKCFGGGN